MKTVKFNQPFQVLKENIGITLKNDSTSLTTPFIWRGVTVSSTNCIADNFGVIYITNATETKTIGEDTYYKASILVEQAGKPSVVWCDHSEYARNNSLYVTEIVEEVETFVLYGIIRNVPTLSGTLRVKQEDGTIYTMDGNDTMYHTTNDYEVNDTVYDSQSEVAGYISATITEQEDNLSNASLLSTSYWSGKYQWSGTTDASLSVNVWTDKVNVETNDAVYCLKDSEDLDVAEATSSVKPNISAQLKSSFDGVNYFNEGDAISGSTYVAQTKVTNVPRGTFFNIVSSYNGEAVICDD